MKLAVLDKDGTLVLPKSGNTFVQNPTDQILMVGVVEGCQRLIDAGYVLAIASNQGGVSAGHKTLDEANHEMSYCMHLLQGFDIRIEVAMLCPDFEGTQCFVTRWDASFDYITDSLAGFENEDLIGTFRKPQAGMLKAISRGLGCANASIIQPTQLEDCWMIGDREEDRLAAEAAGFGFLDADEWRKGASPFLEPAQINLAAANAQAHPKVVDMRFVNLDSIESELLGSALDAIESRKEEFRG
jgi:D-glycero-D-manno-heptose 1,7-bisphosphate phosphatase